MSKMKFKNVSIILNIFMLILNVNSQDDPQRFPEDFLFGGTTIAYEIEGAWNVDGKGASNWDTFTHDHPELIDDGSNGDVASDSYQFYAKDIQAASNLGLGAYQFSLSWSRLLPNYTSYVNEAGVDYYNKVIDLCIANGIQPIVQLYYWEHPMYLEDMGGWTNDIMIDYFATFADLAYSRFGDRVKIFVTITDPWVPCIRGYESKIFPPLLGSEGIGGYLCAHNILKAHARAYHLYKDEYSSQQGGRVGISIDVPFYFSPTNDSDQMDTGMQFEVGWFSHAIFSEEGNYPQKMINQVAAHSLEEGRSSSRLPEFTPEEIEYIKGSSDFFGFLYYSSNMIAPTDEPLGNIPSIDNDRNYLVYQDPNWPVAVSGWQYNVPEGIRGSLRWVTEEYGDVPIIIFSNGWSTNVTLDDTSRIDYLHGHLEQCLDGLSNGEYNLLGYFVLALVDGMVWNHGYSQRFGLHQVDFNSVEKDRKPRQSALWYQKLVATRQIPDVSDVPDLSNVSSVSNVSNVSNNPVNNAPTATNSETAAALPATSSATNAITNFMKYSHFRSSSIYKAQSQTIFARFGNNNGAFPKPFNIFNP